MASSKGLPSIRDERLEPHSNLWVNFWFTVHPSTEMPQGSELSRIKSENLVRILSVEVFSQPYDKDIIDNKRDFLHFYSGKIVGKASLLALKEARENGLLQRHWERLYSSILEGAKRLQESKWGYLLKELPIPNGDLVAYVESYFDSPLSDIVEHNPNGTVRHRGITQEEVAKMVKTQIVRAICHLVDTGRIDLEATADVNNVKDKTIRDAFDEATTNVRLPHFGKKKFYIYVKELGFDWVKDDFGQVLRPTDNQRILAMVDSKGRPISTLLLELKTAYGLDSNSAED